MATTIKYNILDTRDYSTIDNKINNLSNTVNSKERVLQTNINNLFNKHDALKAYAENNKALIDELTTDKISHSEIANDIDGSYATNEAARDVPLSAAFGGVLVNRTAKAISKNDEEYTRATNAERALDERLGVVEHDVNTFLNNADLTADAIDTLREIQNYIKTDGEAAAELLTSINNEATRAKQAESGLDEAKINYTDIVDSVSTDYITPAENNPYSKAPLSARAGSIAYNTAVSLFGDEKTRAEKAEETLSKSISDEVTRATNAESALDTKIGTTINTHNNEVHTALNTKISNIETNITNLQNTKVNTGDIVNNLTDGGIAVPLSAEQGKVLNSNLSTIAEGRILKTSIANDLITNDATKVLAASQGVVLKDLYDSIPAWSLKANKPTYTYAEVGADADGAATDAVSAHNTATDAHSDIRQAIESTNKALTKRIPTAAILDDLDSTVDRTGKVLSAGQGDMLYALIQDLTARVAALEGGSTATE